MPDHVYVYPGYLSKDGTRSDGRRVPAALAVPELTLDRIVAAARKLGFTAEPEPDKQYPRRFFDYAGRVKILKRRGISKTKLLRMLAEELGQRPPESPS